MKCIINLDWWTRIFWTLIIEEIVFKNTSDFYIPTTVLCLKNQVELLQCEGCLAVGFLNS